MEYRKLLHGDEQISVIGVGGGSLSEDVEKAIEILSTAIDSGINFFDLAPSVQAPFHAHAQAFAGRREKVVTQMHFGAVYGNGKYGWTQDVDKIKEQIAWNFDTIGTDYTDFGFLHCIDAHEDLDKALAPGGVLRGHTVAAGPATAAPRAVMAKVFPPKPPNIKSQYLDGDITRHSPHRPRRP